MGLPGVTPRPGAAPGGVRMSVQLQQSERDLERTVREYAERAGWLVYHTFSSRRSPRGFPDLTMVRGDRLVFAELKSYAGRLKGAQKEWLDRLAGTPAEVYLWRTSTPWVEIETVLR